MITLNIKLKQFLEIEDLNIDDDDALEDLSDFDPEVVTSDLGEAEVYGSCEVSIIDNPKTVVRDLDLTISLHDEEQAKSFNDDFNSELEEVSPKELSKLEKEDILDYEMDLYWREIIKPINWWTISTFILAFTNLLLLCYI